MKNKKYTLKETWEALAREKVFMLHTAYPVNSLDEFETVIEKGSTALDCMRFNCAEKDLQIEREKSY